jgi:hypothetical protein
MDPAYGNYAGGTIHHQTGANSYYYCFMRNDGVVFCGELIAGVATNWAGGGTDGGVDGFSVSDTISFEDDLSTAGTIHLKKNGVTVQSFTGKTALTGGFAGIVAVNVIGTQGVSTWESADVGGLIVNPISGRGGVAAHPVVLLK